MTLPPVQVLCSRCASDIELCAFCEKEGCPDPLCYRCVRLVLGQELAQPHDHGG